MSDEGFLRLDDEPQAEVLPPAVPAPMALAEVLPPQFPLQALLQFLPDVKLKQRIASLAAEASALKVVGRDGLRKADQLRETIRTEVAAVIELFDGTKNNPGPCALAYTMHKRLTGLRGDFTKQGEDAITLLDRGIKTETARLDREAEQARIVAQKAADDQAKAAAAALAKTLKKTGADPATVEQAKQDAKTATAPPVHVESAASGALQNSTTARKWKARLKGTPADAESNRVDTCDMSADQLMAFRRLCAAVAQGVVKATLLQVDWAEADRMANADRRTFDVEGMEAFEDVDVRAKGRR